jgi:hypothetical protein
VAKLVLAPILVETSWIFCTYQKIYKCFVSEVDAVLIHSPEKVYRGRAAKGTSTLVGLNIYRQLHQCTVFVENHICIWLWPTGIWGWHWLLICGFTNICYHSFLSSFCICNFSCRSFPGRRFSLERCLLF